MSTALFVGTAGFGADEPHTILKLRLSHADGALSVGGDPTKTVGQNPGWVAVPANAPGRAFVGMEDEAGTIQGYKIDADDPSKLTEAGEAVSSVGQHPCSLALDASGKWLLVRPSFEWNNERVPPPPAPNSQGRCASLCAGGELFIVIDRCVPC
jgi:6-phosphogluconolactonase (cycloisomerase 2 family)